MSILSALPFYVVARLLYGIPEVVFDLHKN